MRVLGLSAELGKKGGMLTQSMVTDSDECCELPAWHATRNGFLPNCWWKKNVLAAAEWLRQSDSVCELLVGECRGSRVSTRLPGADGYSSVPVSTPQGWAQQ